MDQGDVTFVECINKLIHATKRTEYLADTLPILRYIAANLPSAEIFHSPDLTNEDRLSILECCEELKERSRQFTRSWRNHTHVQRLPGGNIVYSWSVRVPGIGWVACRVGQGVLQ